MTATSEHEPTGAFGWPMRRLATILGSVGLALLAAGFTSALLTADPAHAVSVPFVAAFPIVGLVITRHQPRNQVAWCFLASTVLLSVEEIGEDLAPYGIDHHWPGAIVRILAWMQTWPWLPGLFLIITVGLLRFPTGQLLSRRWRWVERAALAAMVVWSVCLSEIGFAVPVRELVAEKSPDPKGLTKLVLDIGYGMFFVVGTCALASLASLIARRRRSSAIEREQLRWVIFAAVVAICIEVALDVWGSYFSSTTAWAQSIGEGIGFALIAIATGVAITRYKLYEIDRIVSRTFSYLIVLAVLAALYIAVIVSLADLLPSGVGQLGVAAATLLVSVLAVPLTRRVRRAVDRRFNRARFDAERVVAAFASRLRARPDRDDIPADLVDVIHRTVAPAHAGVWLLDTTHR